MKPGGGKQKGAAFERQICQALSLWLSRDKRKDLFWRSAMSGGRATVAYKKGVKLSTQGGDISAIDPLGAVLTDAFCIEVKFYKDLDIQAFLLGRGKLTAFWKQVTRDASRYGKEPMLIARQNLYPTLVLVRHMSPLAWRCEGNRIMRSKFVRWVVIDRGIAVGLFDDMLKVPYIAPAVVKRYRPQS
jgi:hypothetical protein